MSVFLWISLVWQPSTVIMFSGHSHKSCVYMNINVVLCWKRMLRLNRNMYMSIVGAHLCHFQRKYFRVGVCIFCAAFCIQRTRFFRVVIMLLADHTYIYRKSTFVIQLTDLEKFACWFFVHASPSWAHCKIFVGFLFDKGTQKSIRAKKLCGRG